MKTFAPNGDERTGAKLVSIGVPIYKRLEYLPAILKMVGSQDYPAIELIVSDNGENGTRVLDMVAAQYSGLYKFRQNPSTVDVVVHHNQIIEAASGEYFFLLSDDDEISANFVSELVQLLEEHPDAALAYAKLEIMDKDGNTLRSSKEGVPVKLSGPDFIRAIWQTYEFGFENVEGFLTRTKLWQDSGGYPHFTKGNHIDNAAVIRLCLQRQVVFTPKCTYRHRVFPESFARAVSMKDLAAASRDFLRWLDREPAIQDFSARRQAEWDGLKQVLERMTWETYLWRWKNLYRHRLGGAQWAREAFRMPFIPAYYQRVASVFKERSKARIKRLFVPRTEPRTTDAEMPKEKFSQPLAKSR